MATGTLSEMVARVLASPGYRRPARAFEDGRACTRCGEFKPRAAFYVRAETPGRLNSHCRDCLRAAGRARRAAERERQRAAGYAPRRGTWERREHRPNLRHPRYRALLLLEGAGVRDSEAATQLRITVRAVWKRWGRIRRELSATTRSEALCAAIHQGIVSVAEIQGIRAAHEISAAGAGPREVES